MIESSAVIDYLVQHMRVHSDAKQGVPCNSLRGWVGKKPGCKRAKPGTRDRVVGVKRKRMGKSAKPAKAKAKEPTVQSQFNQYKAQRKADKYLEDIYRKSPWIKNHVGVKEVVNSFYMGNGEIDTGTHSTQSGKGGAIRVGKVEIKRLNTPSKKYPHGSIGYEIDWGGKIGKERHTVSLISFADGVRHQMRGDSFTSALDRLSRIDHIKQALIRLDKLNEQQPRDKNGRWVSLGNQLRQIARQQNKIASTGNGELSDVLKDLAQEKARQTFTTQAEKVVKGAKDAVSKKIATIEAKALKGDLSAFDDLDNLESGDQDLVLGKFSKKVNSFTNAFYNVKALEDSEVLEEFSGDLFDELDNAGLDSSSLSALRRRTEENYSQSISPTLDKGYGVADTVIKNNDALLSKGNLSDSEKQALDSRILAFSDISTAIDPDLYPGFDAGQQAKKVKKILQESTGFEKEEINALGEFITKALPDDKYELLDRIGQWERQSDDFERITDPQGYAEAIAKQKRMVKHHNKKEKGLKSVLSKLQPKISGEERRGYKQRRKDVQRASWEESLKPNPDKAKIRQLNTEFNQLGQKIKQSYSEQDKAVERQEQMFSRSKGWLKNKDYIIPNYDGLSSKKGPLVKSRRQAIAIALLQAEKLDEAGKPCGASFIEASNKCHIEPGIRRPEKVQEALAQADKLDPKAFLEDAEYVAWKKKVVGMEDAGKQDEADALYEQGPPPFKPNVEQLRMKKILAVTEDPEYSLEYMNPEIWSSKDLKLSKKEAENYLQALDDFGVDNIDDLYDSDLSIKILDPNEKLPKIAGAEQTRKSAMEYDDPREALEWAIELHVEGSDKRAAKAWADEIRAETGDDADPTAALIDRISEDSVFRKAVAKYRDFDPDDLNIGEFYSRESAESTINSLDISSHPNVRKAGRGVPVSRDGEDERIWEWLRNEVETKYDASESAVTPRSAVLIAEALLDRLDRGVPGTATKAKGKRKLNCNEQRSYACGSSCIPNKNNCNKGSVKNQQQRIKNLRRHGGDESAVGKAKTQILGMTEGKRSSLKDTQIAKLKSRVKNQALSSVGKSTGIAELDPEKIKVDPKRFQFKIAASGKTGSVGSLKGVGKFDQNLSGILQVWKDPDSGETFVVNGHNRLDLAKRLGADMVAVRYLDAPNAKAARAIGALSNIAEGRGTALDAGKFFRDTGITKNDLAQKGIPMQQSHAEKGLALSQLNDVLFRKVVDGTITENQGAIIGSGGLKDEHQNAIYSTIKKRKKDISDATLREMVDSAKFAATESQTTLTLFGEEEIKQSLLVERAQLQAGIKQKLAREKKLFGTVARSKSAEDLSKAGNVIDIASSKAVSLGASQALGVFDQQKNLRGPVSDMINEAARRISNGESMKKVQSELYRQITSQLGGIKAA